MMPSLKSVFLQLSGCVQSTSWECDLKVLKAQITAPVCSHFINAAVNLRGEGCLPLFFFLLFFLMKE